MKKVFCILISIILILSSGGITFYITELSPLYNDYSYYREQGVSIFDDRGVTLANYYSKTPKDIDPVELAKSYSIESTDIQALYEIVYESKSEIRNWGIIKATYREKRRGIAYGSYYTSFKFECDEVLHGYCDVNKGETIEFLSPKESLHYYSVDELMLHHYGEFYEKGEQYLIFYLAGSSPRNLISVCKLSGEYPSIKMFPGPVEYDATYFGAETKYVTADEFIDLFFREANEYKPDYPQY